MLANVIILLYPIQKEAQKCAALYTTRHRRRIYSDVGVITVYYTPPSESILRRRRNHPISATYSSGTRRDTPPGTLRQYPQKLDFRTEIGPSYSSISGYTALEGKKITPINNTGQAGCLACMAIPFKHILCKNCKHECSYS